MKKQVEDFPNSPESEDQQDELPSKSQRKRDALRSVDLAKVLLEMPESKRARFNLSTEITDALKLGSEIRSHGAKKRQLHYIGKLLRNSADYEHYLQWHENPHPQQLSEPPVTTGETKLKDGESQDNTMRNRLLEDLAGSMNDLRDQYPNANVQLIRQLVSRINKLSKTENDHPADDNSEKQRNKLVNKLTTAIAQGRNQ
jgi:ribosome-associated protein